MPPTVRLLVLALAGAASALAQEPTAALMARSARAWLAALPPAQQETAAYPFLHDERENWSYVPRRRQGLSLKDQSAAARALALRLLQSALSERGAQQAEAIMALEHVLREIEGSDYRDADLYYVTVFGEPEAPPWGWRFEGHHLSLNVTVLDRDQVVVTPTFFGANPAEVASGPQRGQRTLAAEEDLARQLVRSLDGSQRAHAIIAERAPRDLITGNDRTARPLEPRGVAADQLRPEQRAILERLLRVYVTRYREEISDATHRRMTAAGADALHFAWAGGTDPGEGHYYRIQGTSFLIEYDNTQNGANHVHTAFRDFERDFGRDALREHYREHHHSRGAQPAD